MKKVIKLPNIHIGSIIKEKAENRDVSAAKLAEMIDCHYSTIHYLYEKAWIPMQQLWKISVALEYDFLTEVYVDKLPDNVKNKNNPNTTTVVITPERVSVERSCGTTKIDEYIKYSEK